MSLGTASTTPNAIVNLAWVFRSGGSPSAICLLRPAVVGLRRARGDRRSLISIRKNKQTHEVLSAFREMRAIATAGHDVVRQILAIDVAFLHVSEFRLRDLLIARLDFDRQTGLRE